MQPWVALSVGDISLGRKISRFMVELTVQMPSIEINGCDNLQVWSSVECAIDGFMA
jgi:hypothetical protein